MLTHTNIFILRMTESYPRDIGILDIFNSLLSLSQALSSKLPIGSLSQVPATVTAKVTN